MTKKVIFEHSFLVEKIMCHAGCGYTLEDCLRNTNALNLPEDAEVTIYPEYEERGLHRIFVAIHSASSEYLVDHERFINHFRYQIEVGAEKKIRDESKSATPSRWKHILNIAINGGILLLMLAASLIFPASMGLSLSLSALSLVSTAFTARDYLADFIKQWRQQPRMDMATTISIGWLFACTHVIYHSMHLSFAHHVSLLVMNFMMPNLLILMLNVMDEVKALLDESKQRLQLKGLRTLFPEMAEEYGAYQLTDLINPKEEMLLDPDTDDLPSKATHLKKSLDLEKIKTQLTKRNRRFLQKGMLIQIEPGTCFPVDCILLGNSDGSDGGVLVNTAVMNGEPQQIKPCFTVIEAGMINLGQRVIAYTLRDAFNSGYNKDMFRAHRAEKKDESKAPVNFLRLYSLVFTCGILILLLLSFFLGTLTIGVLLHYIPGIFFGACPCTVMIAQELPQLLSRYFRHRYNIDLWRESLMEDTGEIRNIIFDKTGTLTTGRAQVASAMGIDKGLWDRIYLLEKQYGRNHPLALAITDYFETYFDSPLIDDISHVKYDPDHRGLTARVQNKQIHIGNKQYLKSCGITFPSTKLEQGYTPVYVAEDNSYKGVILMKHEIKPEILETLSRLEEQYGKEKIWMLTGDTAEAAHGFNKQLGNRFAEGNIRAGCTPAKKEDFLKEQASGKGTWFIGDGFNDALCTRELRDRGGVSCSMTQQDKSIFFTDICLNGKLDYVLHHQTLNQFLQKIIRQNKGIILYTAINFLILMISSLVTPLAFASFIMMTMMLSTTLLTVFNSYRVKLYTEQVFTQQSSWFKQRLIADYSLYLMLGAYTCFLIAYCLTNLLVPVIPLALSLLGGTMVSVLTVFVIGYLYTKEDVNQGRLGLMSAAKQPSSSPSPIGGLHASAKPMQALKLGGAFESGVDPTPTYGSAIKQDIEVDNSCGI